MISPKINYSKKITVSYLLGDQDFSNQIELRIGLDQVTTKQNHDKLE